MSHTKGPWKVISEATAREVDVFEIADVSYLRVIHGGGGDGYSVAGSPEDDARLIAAAPCLLEALQSLVEQLEDGAYAGETFADDHPMVAARAAIAKATQ